MASDRPFCPYVGLQPYAEPDHDYFFGRERDQRLIVSNLYAASLTVLYGASGAGKSSILQAGVVPRLRAIPRTAVVVFREWQEPDVLGGLKRACREGFSRAHGEPLALDPAAPLDDLVAQGCGLIGGPVFLLLDQFEEYFLYHPEGEAAFEAEFARTVNREEVDASVLVALREDALAKLDRFRARIPNLLGNTLRLQHLDRTAAETAIRGPLRVYNARFRSGAAPVTVEDDLVNAVLQEVRSGQVQLGRAGGAGQVQGTEENSQIETPFLQLVLTSLWNKEMAEGSSVLRLETFRALGGAEQIARSHLDAVMATFGPEQQDVCARFFDRLVTPSGTKIACRIDDLTRWAGDLAPHVSAVVRILSDRRILRSVAAMPGQPATWRYEVFHDVLAPAILDWRSRYVQARERAAAEAAAAREDAERRRELAQAQALAEEQRRRAEEEARSARRLRLLAAALGVVLLLAVGAAAFARSQRSSAERARADALAARTTSEEHAQLAARRATEAERATQMARSAQAVADAERLRAEEQARLAAIRTGEAERARRDAQADRATAERERSRAEQQARLAAQQAAEARRANADAVQAHGQADLERRRAEQQARFATARALSAAANHELTIDPERSVLLALYGAQLTHSADGAVTIEAEGALHRAVEASQGGHTLAGHSDQVRGVAFSPDGRRVATGAMDGTVRLWVVASGRLVHTLPAHSDAVVAVAFSPDGVRLATAGQDKTARIWNVASGREEIVLRGHTDELTDVAFSPDGERLATASDDKTVRVWDVGSGRTLLVLSGHAERVQGIAYSPDGRRLATASWDNTARIWDAVTGREERSLTAHAGGVNAVAFDQNSRSLVSASSDGTARVWDVASGRELLALSSGADAVMGVAFSPDGSQVVTGTFDGKVRLWKVVAGSQGLTLGQHSNIIWRVAFSPDGTRVATASRDSTARLWHLAPRDLRAVALRGHAGAVTALAFSPDGNRLASASRDATVRVWDAASARELQRISGHSGPIERVAWSADGTRLATASQDQTAAVWNVTTGRQELVATGHQGEVNDLAFNREGTRLLTASRDKTFKLWDTASGEVMLSTQNTHAEGRVALSPDGRYLVMTEGLRVTLTERGSDAKPRTLHEHTGSITRVVFSHDGRRLATASKDKTVMVWDVASGRPEFTLKGHTATVTGVAFSPDGKRLATSSRDGTVRLWELEWGREILSWGRRAEALNDVAFSPDGTRLAVARDDATVLLYPLGIDPLIELARSRVVTRSLRNEECERYIGTPDCPASVKAVARLTEARTLAVAGDMPAAMASLREASRLDPTVAIDAEGEARRWATEARLDEGRALASGGDLTGALASFREAQRLTPGVLADPEGEARRVAASARVSRGEQLARQGKISEAFGALAEAHELDHELRVSASSWNILCWFGSLWRMEARVLGACEKAVALEPENWQVRDSRGVARALTGDTRGAIADFEMFVKHADLQDLKEKRQRWIDSLRRGQNPLTSEELNALKDE